MKNATEDENATGTFEKCQGNGLLTKMNETGTLMY